MNCKRKYDSLNRRLDALSQRACDAALPYLIFRFEDDDGRILVRECYLNSKHRTVEDNDGAY